MISECSGSTDQMEADESLRVVVFGLGEAGSIIAHDLVAAGATVRAFDPAAVPTPSGVTRVGTPGEAIPGAELVMSITAATDAPTAMSQGWCQMEPPAVYADLATASPAVKQELAGKAAADEVPFADVALMAPVPGRGLSTPALASGTGAAGYASVINGLGGRVEVIGQEAGRAAARKLMRSVVTKGLTALLIEALELAATSGDEEWLWRHLAEELSSIDESAPRSPTRRNRSARWSSPRGDGGRPGPARRARRAGIDDRRDDLGIASRRRRGHARPRGAWYEPPLGSALKCLETRDHATSPMSAPSSSSPRHSKRAGPSSST